MCTHCLIHSYLYSVRFQNTKQTSKVPGNYIFHCNIRLFRCETMSLWIILEVNKWSRMADVMKVWWNIITAHYMQVKNNMTFISQTKFSNILSRTKTSILMKISMKYIPMVSVFKKSVLGYTLQRRYMERDGVSNPQPHDCLLSRIFKHRSNKTLKLRITSLCDGNSPVTG